MRRAVAIAGALAFVLAAPYLLITLPSRLHDRLPERSGLRLALTILGMLALLTAFLWILLGPFCAWWACE